MCSRRVRSACHNSAQSSGVLLLLEERRSGNLQVRFDYLVSGQDRVSHFAKKEKLLGVH